MWRRPCLNTLSGTEYDAKAAVVTMASHDSVIILRLTGTFRAKKRVLGIGSMRVTVVAILTLPAILTPQLGG